MTNLHKLLADKHIQPERYRALHDAWVYWSQFSVSDMAYNILRHGTKFGLGIDDDILIARIKDLE
jgi:hypothetical protein